VGQDDKDPSLYVLNVSQSGLGLPDRDYYLSNDAKMGAIRAAYAAHLAKMFELAGEANGVARAQAVVALETAIAKVHWTRIDSRDADKTYNRMTLAQLAASAPGFDFAAMFKAAGLSPDHVLVDQPSAMTGEAALIGGRICPCSRTCCCCAVWTITPTICPMPWHRRALPSTAPR
jgi:putative endopeptidase